MGSYSCAAPYARHRPRSAKSRNTGRQLLQLAKYLRTRSRIDRSRLQTSLRILPNAVGCRRRCLVEAGDAAQGRPARDRRDRSSSTTCGSNGSRCRAWKRRLQQQLSERHGLSVTVAHYPPGASKWNPIEHRLFSEISKNWAGRPLDSDETTLNFIGTTNTTSRLAFLRAWPHHANGVGVDRPIGAYQCQVVFDCLADQHPVERVAVRVWELGDMGDRRLAERQ